MTHTVLILGANGRFGRNASIAFSKAGWQVRHFDRNSDRLTEAVKGVDVIVNAWNPAYTDWAEQVPRLHAQVIAAAKSVGATVIIPGNVYVYGENTPAPWTLTSAHAASNPLGLIRREMEQSYRESGVKTILLRAGDFIDTEQSGNWFDQIITRKIGKGVFTYPGTPTIPHAWAFLPDLTRAAVLLAEKRDELNRYEEVLFPGYTISGQDMAQAISQVSHREIRLKRMGWTMLRVAAPFWRMGRCLLEMSYLWNTPHSLGGERFAQLVPDFQTTPLTEAIRQALPQDVLRPLAQGRARSTQIKA